MPNPDEKPNIYPPEIFDPLKPGGIQSTPDGTEKPAMFTFREENGIRIPTRGPLLGTVVSEAEMLRDVPDPEGVAKDAYLGELAKENMGVDQAEPGGDHAAEVHIKFTVSDEPCATCGQYKVLPGEACPGCGVVR